MLALLTHPRTSLGAPSALMAWAVIGCASGGARSDDLAGQGFLVKKRYAASVARVDSAAARALLDLGYAIARDSGDGGRHVKSTLYFDIAIPQAWGAKHLRHQ
jgi:hypothetical protein